MQSETLEQSLTRIGHPAFKDQEGQRLVHNIMVKKGKTYLQYPSGKMKAVATTIFKKNLARLEAKENPADIVRDMQAQLLLL